MEEQQSRIQNRMFVVFGLVLLIPVAIGMQLFRITFLEGPELRELWSQQTIDEIPIPAQRGNIYDEKGSLLVTNSVGYKVAVDPKINGLTRSDLRQICDTLGKYSEGSPVDYLQKIDAAPSRSRYVVLSSNAGAEAYEALRQLDFRALILEEEYQRRYNFGSLAAHALGFLNHQMTGMSGLEKFYNEQLKGEDGVQQVRRERNGKIYAYIGAPSKQPREGYSLHTTLDSHIQAIVEEELQAGIKRTQSSYGSAVVMDPQTGAIKAMANYPTFNPNYPASLNSGNNRNYVISDMIEPGSTFKMVTAVAALEQEKVSFGEQFKTPEDGKQLIHGQWMRDHDPLGTLSFSQVIEKSSNIATAEIAMRLDEDTFYQYARNMGFGTATNIDLPNEESGRLPKPYEWSQVTLPWMSIGYEVQATPLQLAQAYAAFANDGMMMQPYLVEKIVDSEGDIVSRHQPASVRQIAEEETLRKLYPVFRDVVSDSGTAEYAQVEGLSIAGKTGTAQKFIDGRYRNKYRSSFVGFFPVENPRYVSIVVLDDPDTYPPYGGTTAGPIFQHIAKRIAGLDNEIEKQIIERDGVEKQWAIAPDFTHLRIQEARVLAERQQLPYQVTGEGGYVVAQHPEPGTALASTNELTLELSSLDIPDTTQVPAGYSIIPDVGGMSMRKAMALINRRGFEAKMIGSGTIYTQFPRPGDRMEKGRTVTVRGKAKSMEILAQRGGEQ